MLAVASVRKKSFPWVSYFFCFIRMKRRHKFKPAVSRRELQSEAFCGTVIVDDQEDK
jgi:hypothetical protein